MKYLTVSDTHGRNSWERAIFEKEHNSNTILQCYIGKRFDKVVFLGDYVDSYDKTNEEILTNLKNIIDLKKQYPNDVILLLGNHDFAYLYNERCSGYRPEMDMDIVELLNKNINLFKIAYQDKNVIFVHAGITKGWYNYHMLPIIEGKKETRYTPYLILCDNIADQLNLMFEFNEPILRMCGRDRGGIDRVGGPLWVDKENLYKKPIEGFHQIVGHTAIDRIKVYDFKNNTKLTFTDCANKEFYYINV